MAIILLFLLVSVNGNSQKVKKEESAKAHIVYILADDIGYGDIGPYGQKKIETPNIDALAKKE